MLSGVLTGMPSPAVLPGMMVECGVYGLVSGLMMQAVHTKKLYADLYISQITAMLLGRILSGVCKALIFAPAIIASIIAGRGRGDNVVCDRPARHCDPARAAADARCRADEGAAAAGTVRIRGV